MVKYCRKCGASLSPNASFCRKCGTKVMWVQDSQKETEQESSDAVMKAAEVVLKHLKYENKASGIPGEMTLMGQLADVL